MVTFEWGMNVGVCRGVDSLGACVISKVVDNFLRSVYSIRASKMAAEALLVETWTRLLL